MVKRLWRWLRGNGPGEALRAQFVAENVRMAEDCYRTMVGPIEALDVPEHIKRREIERIRGMLAVRGLLPEQVRTRA